MDEREQDLSEEDRIEILEKGSSRNLYSMVGMGGVVLLLLSIMISGFVMMSLRISSLTDWQESNKGTQQQIMVLQEQVSAHSEHLIEFNRILATLNVDEQTGAVAQLLSIQTQREVDQQAFLTSMEHATISLSRMVPGTRAWHDDFKGEMEKIRIRSEKRRQEIDKLRGVTPTSIPNDPQTDAFDSQTNGFDPERDNF